MMTTGLWRAVEAAGCAAPRRAWIEELGREWDRAEPLFRQTGRRARELACPKASEAGCIRQVIPLIDGTLRAECGDLPARCDHLVLERADLSILEIDRRKLVRVLAGALDLQAERAPQSRDPVHQIGRYEIAAGRGFPVFLCLPSAGPPATIVPLDMVIAAPPPRLLLTPCRSSLDPPVREQLAREGVSILALEDAVLYGDDGVLAPAQPPARLFEGVIEKLQGALSDRLSVPLVDLPADATWEELSIRFISDGVINASIRGTTRRLEPDDLGLKNQTNGQPTRAWIYLKLLACNQGRLPVHAAMIKETSSHQKQKQALSKALKSAFGLAGDPIVAEDGDYVARFVASADDLDQGRQGQSGRNFVRRA